MASSDLRDERLAWLAVRNELRKRSRRGLGQLLLRLGGAVPASGTTSFSNLVSDPVSAREQRDSRMVRYAIVVDALVGHLSDEERAILRRDGTVPAWFLPRVLEDAKSVRF